jgi:hypothetical protein
MANVSGVVGKFTDWRALATHAKFASDGVTKSPIVGRGDDDPS